MEQVEVYIYLDRQAVESLFAQTADRLITELRESSEEGRDRKASAKVGLGKALAAFLGIQVDVGAEQSEGRKRVDEVKSTLAVEHKLARLEKYLTESGELITDLDAAVGKARERAGRVFIKVATQFDAPQFLPRGGGAAEATKDGGILFETIEGFSNATVKMAASLTKFPTAAGGRLSTLSHLAIQFRGQGGRNIPLKVVGYLLAVSDRMIQIKPYAISLG